MNPKRRATAAKKEIIRRAGGLLDAGEVADHLELSEDAVERKRERGELLAVEGTEGGRYPACQFTEEGVVDGLPEALRSFHYIASPWVRLSVLVSGRDVLEGQTVIEALQAGRRSEALKEISRFGRM